jgi:hypothetical protein
MRHVAWSCALYLAISAHGATSGPSAAPGLALGEFEGSPAYRLSNETIELTFLPQGASLAGIVLSDDRDKLNPLWNAAQIARVLGKKGGAPTMTGHILALDGFGPPSPEERQAGLPMLGEAHVSQFDVESSRRGTTIQATLIATLPIAQEKLTRTLRMVQGEHIVYVETRLESLLGFDRPIGWGEHATVGPPFVEAGVTLFDLSGTRSQTTSYSSPTTPNDPSVERRLASNEEFNWPAAPGREGTAIDMRGTPANAHYIDHVATLMDPTRELEWATAINPKRKLILGYVFRRKDFPWLQTWGSYPSTNKPVRGMEFATQPFAEPRREAVTQGRLFDTATFQWLPARATLTTNFLMFYARIPEHFTKVDDVRLENGQLVIEDRAAGRQLRLIASLGL